jgi:hypothetical protein
VQHGVCGGGWVSIIPIIGLLGLQNRSTLGSRIQNVKTQFIANTIKV